ncbi:Cadmium/zinc-transporting ATPase 4-like protein [Gossypium australe]|uniref:Cadmium/zinc-transporting ATPase 4-like protein n=1 Tax=Gossypium australe TaxID=47621 RepID=A0A5B6WXP3_9ROSI|nr:Cadmium/zinc-transporting ATPase 4-like protein [Gossypium australe]
MSTISFSRTNFFTYACNGSSPRHKLHSISLTPTTKMNAKSIGLVRKEDHSVFPRTSLITHLKFNSLEPSDEDLFHEKKLVFGNYVARQAVRDEELWVAAYLRAETHWEDQPGDERLIEHLKMDFIEREFNSLKMRCRGQFGQINKCVVAVCKPDLNVQRTVIKSVVGTLDISIRHLLHGETFPGQHKKYRFPIINTKNLQKFAYISNLCTRKSARRQGIGSNMMRFVIEFAKLSGIKSVYVHVCRDNKPAFNLYRKLNFEVVEMANAALEEEQMYLLCYKA